jgi:PleD family two-component response regulator
VLRECSREKDFVARFGGEAFYGAVDIAAAEVAAACERIRVAIAGAAWSGPCRLGVTVSFGLPHFDKAGGGMEVLVKLADAGCFKPSARVETAPSGRAKEAESQFAALA